MTENTKLTKPDAGDWNLKNLSFNQDSNPLMDDLYIALKKRTIRSRMNVKDQDLVNPKTGEIVQSTFVHVIKEVDDEQFVKIFSKFVSDEYELSSSAMKVFRGILQVLEQTPMTNGYVDSIYLKFFDNGISGIDIGVKERTFNKGLKELLAKRFLSPKMPNVYWINPSLFFKGDRALMVNEIRRKEKLTAPEQPKQVEQQNEPTDQAAE